MSLLILTLGNDLLGDDGIGLLAADILAKENIQDAKVLKSSLSGLYLIDLIEGFDDLIIVDSIIGNKPGNIVQLKLQDVGPKPVPSAHYAGLPEALNLAKRAGMEIPNRVAIVAMQIHDSQVLGTGVSPKVKEGLPELVNHVIKIARRWGYEVKHTKSKKHK